MISPELSERIDLYMLENHEELAVSPDKYKDVMIDGREHTAVLFEGRWYLYQINFKFGDGLHRGHPYLEGDPATIREVESGFLDGLPTW